MRPAAQSVQSCAGGNSSGMPVGRDELRATVATLQKALDLAHERIRQQEQTASAMNERYAQVLAERDTLEMRLHDSDAELRRRQGN